MKSAIAEDELANDVIGAEEMITQHQEYHAEIETRKKSIETFEEQAKKLVIAHHSAAGDIKEKSIELASSWEDLIETWNIHKVKLDKNFEVQTFIHEADQAEGWINARSLNIECEDLGDSLEAVEELLKKHDEFEKMLMAQEEKVFGLQRLTQEEELKTLKEAEEKKRMEDILRKERELEQKKEREEKRRQKQREEQHRKLEEKRKNEERVKQEAERLKMIQEQKLQIEAEEKLEAERLWSREEERQRLEEAERVRAQERKLKEQRVEAEKQQRIQELRQREQERNKKIAEVQLAADKQKHQEQERKFDHNRNNTYRTQNPLEAIKNEAPLWNKAGINMPLCEGILQRKQELEVGGRKSQTRAWKTYFTVMKGRQLLFFREKKDLQTRNYAAPPLNLRDGFCEKASDYTKRKNTMRIILSDGSEYLFVAKDLADLTRWVKKIQTIIENGNGGFDDNIPISPPPPRFYTSPLSKEVCNQSRSSKPVITITTPDEETEDEGPPAFAPPPPPLSNQEPVLPPSDFAIPENIPPPNPDMSLKRTNVEGEDANDVLPDIPPLDVPPPEIPLPDIPPPNIPETFPEDEPPDIPHYPPPSDNIEIRSPNGIYLEIDSDEDLDDLPSPSPPVYLPSQLENKPKPPPRRKQRAPPPPSIPRSRSDSQESRSSTDSLDKLTSQIPTPKFPVTLDTAQPLKTNVDSDSENTLFHEGKKHDKKKGMFGNIFKKKR